MNTPYKQNSHVGSVAFLDVDIDPTLAANSDALVAPQKAVKEYVDDSIAAIPHPYRYIGEIDCSGNPNYPAADSGFVYRASVAGKIGGSSGVATQVGDEIICHVDGSLAGDQAAVGANWNVIQANLEFSTDAETITGTIASKVINPANLKAKLGTQTDHGILLGSGQTEAVSATAAGATGEIVIGQTGADPIWSANPVVTSVSATTFDTNVAAAGVTLAGTTLAADGTDAAIDINITPKGTGEVNITKVDIDAGTIDGATIATSNITVGAGKTLDVSAGTFTLANDQISGDKVEGGTIAAITITALTTTTAADNTSTTQAATTAFVQRALYLNAPMYYGISWDESADTYTRTGKTAGYACGKTLSEALLPIQSRMRRCVINDAGVVQYYLFGTNSALKENGITASVLTGANGQVMVEIPKFYYKHTYVGTVHTWEISPIALDGFDVHPAFMSGATELNYIYVGAYEGVLWDNSAGAYVNYNAAWEAANDIDPATDKLSSVSGFIPQSSFTRATGRAIAALRGTGWSQELYDIRSAVQLLYLIEYASFNSQSMIGLGICNVNDWPGFDYYPFAPTGNSNSIGNATGNNAGAVAGYAAEATKYMSYRGIEHFFGHIRKWLDGINTNSNRSYVCNVAVNLADNTTANYTDIGINNKNDDGYQNTLLNISRGFLPAADADADAVTKITDYYYQGAGWRVASCGGLAHNGLSNGVFGLNLSDVSSNLNAYVGARVCFRK